MKKVPVLKIEKRHWKLDTQCSYNQLSIGLPMALQFSITAVGTILVQMALNMLGSTVVAAYTAACKVEQLVTQPYGALGLTMSTYCAQNRGVNDIKRIRKGVRVSNVMSLIYSLVIYGIIMAALPYIIRLFVSGDVTEILEYARIYVGVCGLCFTGLGMIFIFRNAMQGCGFSFMPMMGGVVELLCRAVAAFIAAQYQSYLGVCMGNASSWVVTGIFLAIAYLFMMRKLVVLQKQPLKQ